MNQAEKHGVKVELRERRMERHLSQGQLAELLKMDQGYISRIERGEVLPYVQLANRIAKVLKFTTFDIWIEKDAPE